MVELILSSLYFMLPAYIANATPVISAKLNIFKSLNTPIDKNKTIGGKPLFGKTKTIRGFVVGTFCAVIIGLIQFTLFNNEFFKSISLVEYSLNTSLLLSLLLGFGALLGDLIKSFIKRRIGIVSSQPFIVFDQIDYALGALLLSSLIFVPSLNHIIIILIISPILSFLSNVVSYFLGIKKVWW